MESQQKKKCFNGMNTRRRRENTGYIRGTIGKCMFLKEYVQHCGQILFSFVMIQIHVSVIQ